ncbi:MAG: hypothetical protein HRU12_11770 [Phaeodactylibacter sp.]|nr:hypothetical protein [Phaeodactylibacter sp.]
MRVIEMDLPDEELGVYAISIVDQPAIESNFIALSKPGKQQYSFAKLDEEKRLLVGAALIPNKQILRIDENNEPYYIFFPKSVVKKAAYNFLKNSMHLNATLQHENKVSGLSVVESWLVEDSENDKCNNYGLKMPVGTWMIAMKVDNQEIWENEVKSQNVRGFSIEAFFTEKLSASKVQKSVEQSIIDTIVQSVK